MRPLRLAHRGDWRRFPENSLGAMRAALAVPGCDGLEFDVRLSRDGVPVLLHDATLDRVQRVRGEVSASTAADLADHGIPGLADVLAAVGRQPFLDVELKTLPNEAFLEVLGAARAAPDAAIQRVAISSFEPASLAWIARRRPGWTRWLNALDLEPVTIARARDLGCSAVAALWRSVDGRGIERARAAGLDVAAWTVRRRPTRERLAGLGVSAICVEGAALDG